ncbi:MAG: TetR family transcriptional regulator [Bacteroidales bacterium]
MYLHDKVRFEEIQHSTGFSRGTILYHFKHKQDIFNEVVEKYLFGR